MNKSFPKNIKIILGLIIIILIGLHILSAFIQLLITDEFETIATSRFIHQGKIIFKDFFQHHGTIPYFFYSLAFFFNHEILNQVFIMKFLSFLIWALIIFLIFKLIKKIAGDNYSPIIGFIPIFIFLNDVIFWRYGLQIRTDNLMIVFLLLYLNELFDFEQKGTFYKLLTTGFWASLAFFSKQSSILIIGLFSIFYFRFEIKKYLILLFGSLPVFLVHFLYFLKNNALLNFINYFCLFNFFHQSQLSNFNLKERFWFIFSPDTSFLVKTIYVCGFLFLLILGLLFFKKQLGKNAIFSKALFKTAFISILVTPLWKTPYPQYYMPVQILFLLLGVYYLVYLKKYKKFFLAMIFSLILLMPLVTIHYFKTITKSGLNVYKQIKPLKIIKEKFPENLKILGPLPFFLIFEPAGFHWFYPPIFIDLNRNFLISDIKNADLVFYDSRIYFFAPAEFKKILFEDFYFIERFYFPFYVLNKNEFNPIAIYAKDKKLAENLKKTMKNIPFLKPLPQTNLLNQPIYIPVFFEATLINKEKTKTIDYPFSYREKTTEPITLKITISSNHQFFDQTTNASYPLKPQIKFSLSPKKVTFKIPYPETIKEIETIGFKNREHVINKETFLGIIEVIFNQPYFKPTILNIENGYELFLNFHLKNLEIKIGAFEKNLSKKYE